MEKVLAFSIFSSSEETNLIVDVAMTEWFLGRWECSRRGQFWLKSHLSALVELQVAQCCMSAQFELGEPDSEPDYLGSALLVVLILGVLVGVKATLVGLPLCFHGVFTSDRS